MVKMYDPKSCKQDLNEFVEVREVEGRLLAIFHVADGGHDQSLVFQPPTDPEVGLTKEQLEERISKRESAGKEVSEEKKAWQDPCWRKRGSLADSRA